MKKFFLFLLFAGTGMVAFTQVQPSLLVSGCPDSKSVVVMNYKTQTLIWLDIQKETGKETVIGPVSPEGFANMTVLNDSLVLLSGKHIYNYRTGSKLTSPEGSLFSTPSGKKLYRLKDGVIAELDATGNETSNRITLNGLKGTVQHNLIKINEAGTHAAITAVTGKKDVSIFIADLKQQKIIKEFDDFKEGGGSKSVEFLDISPDGSQLIAGNSKAVKLFNISSGKELGAFEEIPKNNRVDFQQASFAPDGKMARILSAYKIYTLNTVKFEAEENIVVSNNIHITRWNDKYGLTHKEKVKITTDYFWYTYTLMADNKYIIGIAKHKKEDDYILYYMFLGEGGIGNKNMAL
jgi:WD40 repeat protein